MIFRRPVYAISIATVLLLCVSIAVARTWTSRDGKFTTEAEFLGFSDGKVRLKKTDGKEIVVPLEKLSVSNRIWVKGEVRRQQKSEQKLPSQADDDQEPTEKFGLQTVAMKLEPLKLPTGKKRQKSDPMSQYMLAMTRPQSLFVQTNRGKNRYEEQFRRLVRKEPEYCIKKPFLAVVKFGPKTYALAFDALGKKPKGYNTLYFDVNCNGDLSDDKPTTAKDVQRHEASGSTFSNFPAISLPMEIDGVKFECPFLINAGTGRSSSITYTQAQIRTAAVRQGEIQQGKRKIRLVLVDQNSNGRFDDRMSIRKAGSRLSVTQGDLLLVNPNIKARASATTPSNARHFVSRTVCIGKHFYKMEVTPAGDQLKLEPAELAMGFLTNPSPLYRATVYSDDFGVVMIGGRKGQKIPLPEGDWKMADYTIVAPGTKPTTISATFDSNSPAMNINADKTLALAFGSPFRPVVKAYPSKDKKISLSLSVVGIAGERCTDFRINGKRPGEPRFEIRDKDKKLVYQGKFKWG